MECKLLPVKINGLLQQIPYRSIIGKRLEVSKKDVIDLLEKISQTTKYGFKLSIDKTGKDQGKANYANAYIGLGVPNRKSSTEIYLEDAKRQGIPVNDQIVPNSNTVAFVSVASEGTRVEETFELVKRVLDAGGTIIMDKSGTGFGQSHSSFNIKGEGRLQDMIKEKYGEPKQTKEGYNYWGPDVEKQKPSPTYSKIIKFINNKFKDQPNVLLRSIIAGLSLLYFPDTKLATTIVDKNKPLKEKLDALTRVFTFLDNKQNKTEKEQEYIDTIYGLLSLDFTENKEIEEIKEQLIATEEITVNSEKEFKEALNKIQKELEDKPNKTFTINIKFDDDGKVYQEYKKLVNDGKIKEAFINFKVYDNFVDKSFIDKNQKLSNKVKTRVEGTSITIVSKTPKVKLQDDENIKRTEYIAKEFANRISEKLGKFKYDTVLIGEYNTPINVKKVFQNLFIRYLFHLNENDYDKIANHYEFEDKDKEKFKSIMIKVSDYLKSDKLDSAKPTLYELLEFLNEKNISLLNLITTVIEVLEKVSIEENEEGYISYRIVKNIFFDGLLKNNISLISSLLFKILRDESVSKLKEDKKTSSNKYLSENIIAIVDKYVQEKEFQDIRNNIRELLNLKHQDIEDAFVDMLKMFLSTSLYYSVYVTGVNEESIDNIINISFGIVASSLKRTISEFLFAGHYQDMDISKSVLDDDSDLTLKDDEVYETNGENDDDFITASKLENKELNDIGAINFVMLTFVNQMLGPNSENIDVVDLYNGLVIKLKTFLLNDTIPLYFDSNQVDFSITSESQATDKSNIVFEDYLKFLNNEKQNNIKSKNLIDYLPFIYFTKEELSSIKSSNDLEKIISEKSSSEFKIERTVFHRLKRKMTTIYPVTNIDYERNTKDLMVLLAVRDNMTVSHYARITNKKIFQNKSRDNRIGPSNIGRYLVYKGYLKPSTVATLNNVIDGKDSKLVENAMKQLLNDNIPKDINKYALINQFMRMLFLAGADLKDIDLNGYIGEDKDMYKVIKDILVKSSNDFKELYKNKEWDKIKNNIIFKLSYIILNEVGNLDLSEVRGFESIVNYINNLDGFSFSDVLYFAKMLSDGFENLYKFYDAKGIDDIRDFVGYYNAITNYDVSSDDGKVYDCANIRTTYVRAVQKNMLTAAQTKLTRVMFSVIDDHLLTFLKMKIDTYKGTSRQERSYPNKGLANAVVVTAVDKKIYDKGYFAYLFEKMKSSNGVDNVNVISFRNRLIKSSSMLRPLLNIKLFHSFGTVYTIGAGVKKTQLSLGFSSSVYQYYSPNKRFGINPSMGISEVIEKDIEDKYKNLIIDTISQNTKIDKDRIRKFIEIVYSRKKAFNYGYIMKMLKVMVEKDKDIRGQKLIDTFKMLLVHDTMDPLMVLIHPLFERNNWFVEGNNNYFTGETQLKLFTQEEYDSIINTLKDFYNNVMKVDLNKSNGYQYFSLYYSLLTFIHAEISARLEYEKLVSMGSKDLKIPKSYYEGVYDETTQTFNDIPVFRSIANEIFSGKGYDREEYKEFYNSIKNVINEIYNDIKNYDNNNYILENISFDKFYRLLNEMSIKNKNKDYLAYLFAKTMEHLSKEITVGNITKTIFEIDVERKYNNTELSSLYNDILNKINLLKTLIVTNNIRADDLMKEIKEKLRDLNSFLPVELYTNDEIVYSGVLYQYDRSGQQDSNFQQKVLNTLIEKHNSNKHDLVINTITKIRRAVGGLLSFDFESPLSVVSIVPEFINKGDTRSGILVKDNDVEYVGQEQIYPFENVEVLENTLNILKGVILEHHNYYVNGIVSLISTYAQYSMLSNVIYTETGNLKRSNALTSPGVKPSYDNVVISSDLVETQKVLSNIQTQNGLKTLETKDTIIDLTQLNPIRSLLEEIRKDYEIKRRYIKDENLLKKYDEKYRSLVKAYKEANHTDGFCMVEIHTAYLTLKALGYDTSGILDKLMLYVNKIDSILLDKNINDEEKIKQYIKLRNEFIKIASEDITFNNLNFLGAIKMQYAGGKSISITDEYGNIKVVDRVLSNHKYTWYPIHPLLNATTVVSSYEELSHTEKEMLKLYTLMRENEVSYITSGEKINPVTKPSEIDDTVNNNKESIFYYSTENINGRDVIRIHVNEKVFNFLSPTYIGVDNLKLNSFYIDEVKEKIPLNVKLLNLFNSGEIIGVNDITFKLGYFYFYLQYLSAGNKSFNVENLDEQTKRMLNLLMYAREKSREEWYSVDARKYFGTSYTQVVGLEVLLPLAPGRLAKEKEKRIKEVFNIVSEINNRAVDEIAGGREVHFVLTNDAANKLLEIKEGQTIGIVYDKKMYLVKIKSLNVSDISPNNQLVKTYFSNIGDDVVIQNNFKIVSIVPKDFETIDVVETLKYTLLESIFLDDKENIENAIYGNEQYKNLQGDRKEKSLQIFTIYDLKEVVSKSSYNITNGQINFILNSLFTSELEKYNFLFFGYKLLKYEDFTTTKRNLVTNKDLLIDRVTKTLQIVYNKLGEEDRKQIDLNKVKSYFTDILNVLYQKGYIDKEEEINKLIKAKQFTDKELELVNETLFNVLIFRVINFKYFGINNSVDYSFLNAAKQVVSFNLNFKTNISDVRLLIEPSSNVLSKLQELYIVPEDDAVIFRRENVSWNSNYIPLLFLKHPDGKYIKTVDRLNEALLDENFVKQNEKLLMIVGLRVPLQTTGSTQIIIPNQFLLFLSSVVQDSALSTRIMGNDYDDDKLVTIIPEKKVVLKDKKGKVIREYGLEKVKNKEVFEEILSKIDSGKYDVEVVYEDGIFEKLIDMRYRYEKTGSNFKYLYQMVEKGTNFELASKIYAERNKDSENSGISYVQQTRKTAYQRDVTTRIGNVVYLQGLQDRISIKMDLSVVEMLDLISYSIPKHHKDYLTLNSLAFRDTLNEFVTMTVDASKDPEGSAIDPILTSPLLTIFGLLVDSYYKELIQLLNKQLKDSGADYEIVDDEVVKEQAILETHKVLSSISVILSYYYNLYNGDSANKEGLDYNKVVKKILKDEFKFVQKDVKNKIIEKYEREPLDELLSRMNKLLYSKLKIKEEDYNKDPKNFISEFYVTLYEMMSKDGILSDIPKNEETASLKLNEEQELLFAILHRISLLSDTLLKQIFDEEIMRPLNYIISSTLTPNVIRSIIHAIMVTQVKEKYKIDTKLIEGIYKALSNSFYYPINEDRALYGDTTANIVLYNSFDKLMFEINPTFKKVYGTYYSHSASKSIEMPNYELRKMILEDVNLNFDRSRLEVLLNKIDKSKTNFGKTIENETNQQSEDILKDIKKMLNDEQIFNKVLSKLKGKEEDIRVELLNKIYDTYKNKKGMSEELRNAYAKIAYFILIYYKHFTDIANLNKDNTENPFNIYTSFLSSILNKLSDEDVIEYANSLYKDIESFYDAMYMIVNGMYKTVDKKTGKEIYRNFEDYNPFINRDFHMRNNGLMFYTSAIDEENQVKAFYVNEGLKIYTQLLKAITGVMLNNTVAKYKVGDIIMSSTQDLKKIEEIKKKIADTSVIAVFLFRTMYRQYIKDMIANTLTKDVIGDVEVNQNFLGYFNEFIAPYQEGLENYLNIAGLSKKFFEDLQRIIKSISVASVKGIVKTDNRYKSLESTINNTEDNIDKNEQIDCK